MQDRFATGDIHGHYSPMPSGSGTAPDMWGAADGGSNLNSGRSIAQNIRHWFRSSRPLDNSSARAKVFQPYRRPIVDAYGGGVGVQRQMNPLSPQLVWNQNIVRVPITGNGSELTGQLALTSLVTMAQPNSSAPGN